MALLEQNSVVDWSTTYLPKELLGIILDKLTQHSDYIRFGAVCKSWHSVAVDHKQHQIAKIYQQPPLLLITTPQEAYLSADESGSKLYSYKLYSISEHKFYNCEFQLPHRLRYLGSSYGWLAVREFDLSITLINPFTGKRIFLPMIYLPLHKIILSCDPSTCQDDLVVAAIYYGCFDDKVVFVSPGEESWTFFYDREVDGDCVKDIVFHKGMLCIMYRYNGLIIIDHSRYNQDYKFAIKVEFGNFSVPSSLVEASNGDLLLLVKHPISYTIGIGTEPRVGFCIYKLVKKEIPSSDKEEFHWQEIHKLENDDTIFLGVDHSLCISASCFPDCNPNSIYFLHNFEIDVEYSCDLYLPAAKDVEIGLFHLDNTKATKLQCLEGFDNYTVPVAWISPTLS